MDSVGLLAQMGIKVALGVLLAVAAAALARRFHRMGNGGRAQTGSLQVAETAALGQNRALHLIRVGRRAPRPLKAPGGHPNPKRVFSGASLS